MKKNILIVEDNKASRDALAELTRECDSASAVYCAENSAEAYKYAMEYRIDLFLIDIVLDNTVPGDVSGMVFADKIRQLERYRFVPMIFVTALEDQAMVAFHKLHSYGYIEKPFDFVQVRKTISDALKFPSRDERKDAQIFYRKDGILYAIETEEIIYMETVYRNMLVYLTKERIEIPNMTCRAMLDSLNGHDFLQYNRGGILNRKYIDYVDEASRYVKMKNGARLEIGRVVKKKFMQELKYDS